MTEQEWLASDDPQRMLAWVTRSPECVGILAKFSQVISDRKLRLFACACMRLQGVAPDLCDDQEKGIGYDLIQWAEEWAEGGTRATQPQKAVLLRDIVGNPWRPYPHFNASISTWCHLPEVVLAIAQAIHKNRCFEDMPVLGDALEESGCDNQDVLRHCRGEEGCCEGWRDLIRQGKSTIKRKCRQCKGTGWRPLRGPHVRGCWVLDLMLGLD